MVDSPREPLAEDRRPEIWANWPGAVLLNDEIEFYCTSAPPLISPFDRDNLKPARYQLTLGNEARLGGKPVSIDKDHPLVIPAHQVAIVRTHETLNIPRFLIGRWNLRVDMVYKGLLWVGALQVDPGWVGYLPCPLYNLSNEEVRVDYREKYVSIDFVRTTKFGEESIPYLRPPYNPPISLYDPNSLRSGPYERLKELSSFRDEVQDTTKRVDTLTNSAILAFSIIVAVLAVIVAVVAILVTEPPVERFVSVFGTLAFIASAISLGVAALALARCRKHSN